MTNVRPDRIEPNDTQGAVYKIKCSDCYASFIRETGRDLTSFNTRLIEYKRATRNDDVNNHISEHHGLTNHRIDWNSAECLTYITNYFHATTDSGKMIHKLVLFCSSLLEVYFQRT